MGVVKGQLAPVQAETDGAVRSTELRRDSEGVVRHGSEWLQLWADPDSLRSPEARARAQDAARHTARAQRALAAALRAMSGRPGLAVRFRAGDAALQNGEAVLPAASGHAAARGAADRLAAWLRHHGAAPAPPDRLLHMLEMARCEALEMQRLPGTAGNLDAYSAWHLEQLGFAQARLPGDLPLDEALAVVMRAVLSGRPLGLDATALQIWDRWVRSKLRPQCAALQAALPDSCRYTAAAKAFIAALHRSLDATRDAPSPPPQGGGEADAPHTPRVELPALSTDADAPAPAAGRTDPVAACPYRAFTTAHDRVLAPGDICSEAELLSLRAKLDAETGAVRSLLSRLAAQLQRRLLAQRRSTWDFDRDDGVLDTGRLDRVVTNPAAALAFKQERDAGFRDTVVGLLIDCSGSMRGRPILLAAIAADVTARALEQCGVACEVLGFTTADFTGGRSAQDWARAARPPNPGRLGDLRHIVIKSAATGYRAARPGFGVLLAPGLLRENVDGEALAWAHRRLLARPEPRRVLVAISDGAPAEAATGKANPPGLLEAHLDSTLAAIASAGRVEIRAIGIRHDVSRHYKQSVMLNDAQMVGPALMAQLADVFSPASRRPLHARQP